MTDAFEHRLGQTLTKLSHNHTLDGETVRATAVRTLVELHLESVGRAGVSRPANFAELMAALLPRLSLPVRAEAARRLAHDPYLPEETARLLADDDYDVAGPVLRQSPVLKETTLLEAAAGACPLKARAVAARGRLSPSVVTALLDREDPAITVALATSQHHLDGAEASRVALGAPLPRAAVRRLSQTPGISSRALAALFWKADPAGRRAIIDRLDERHAAMTPEEAATGPAGTIDPTILSLAAQRRHDAMIALVASGLALPETLARDIVTDRTGEPLALAARAGGLPIDHITGVVLLTAPDASTSYAALRDLVSLAERTSPELARRIVGHWLPEPASLPAAKPMARHERAIAPPAASRPRAAMPDQGRQHPRVKPQAPAHGETQRRG